MIDNNNILKILLEADADPNDPQKQPNEKPTKPHGFEEDPMGFIIRKYHGLTRTLVDLMSSDFKQYLTAIFVVAPKPTTFKIVLHNGQFFFITYMGKGFYEANISGKRYYMNNIGTKERAMQAIARLLKFGSPLKTKGPEGAEQGTREDDGTGNSPNSGFANGGGGGYAQTGGGEEGGEEAEETGGEETGGEESLKEISLVKSLLKFKNVGQNFINALIKEVYLPSKSKIKVMKKQSLQEANLTAPTLFKAIQKTLSDAKYNVTPENKGNRGPVLRTNFETSKNVQSLIEKAISKLLPKDSFKVQEFQKNQGESKSGTYPTYKVQLTKAADGYKKGESVFIVSTVKEGASTKTKALTPVKLGLTTGKFKTASSLASTIKRNVPNVTNDKSLKELLDSLVDDVFKGAAKGKFADTAEITKFDQEIPLSERTRKALTKVSPQDVGMIGSDFGECLGAIALLKSVVNPGSGIIFPAAEANPLADFQLDGFNVSAKYNKGGAATITDTIRNIKPEQLTTPGQKSLYKLLKIILAEDVVQGPITIGKALKLDGMEKLSQIIKVPVQNIDAETINSYLIKLLKSATTDEQKDAIIKKKFGPFFASIKKQPAFPIRWRDISPKAYYGVITSPLINYIVAFLNSNKNYKKALTDIMSKSEVKQLYLTMNVKQNTARFNLKSFSSAEFEFESSLSIYNPKNKKLAFRML